MDTKIIASVTYLGVLWHIDIPRTADDYADDNADEDMDDPNERIPSRSMREFS